jgi:hypothetical protein
MVVSRRRASACCSCSWSPARASSARTARRPPLWQDMQGPWRVPAKNVGTTPAEVRGIKKLDDGRRMPRLVYGLVYKGLSALPGTSPYLRLSCKCWKNERADERTRTADLISLRVITQALQGCAGGCKCHISKGISLLCLAARCTVLLSRWYQSGINRAPVVRGQVVSEVRRCRVASLLHRSADSRTERSTTLLRLPPRTLGLVVGIRCGQPGEDHLGDTSTLADPSVVDDLKEARSQS